ncbi:hypothetical protein MARPO_0043s0088 [Marchantia polymorpha]|uniref:Dynein heavy chain C-terminal domain-containing protein n=1 Tax=Marchantia polymorpha TaxID=3197 RepID=A0A2R6X162_MARPO|nr:hypothetical protein MARPO_0043s0088 [Marchantia polymorpha]|eukprot:PTQ39847.1 hypothetical protein MARPO_0043s0088 [Marchantia polymorpha]
MSVGPGLQMKSDGQAFELRRPVAKHRERERESAREREIDTVGWNFKCMPKGGNYDKKPEDGCYIYGMSLEGARWDDNDMSLAESDPKVLFSPAPLIWLQPCVVADKKKFPCYSCPLYRTTERRGVLATTGHSSNFVINIDLPSEKSQDHWIRRGVAMLLTLSD